MRGKHKRCVNNDATDLSSALSENIPLQSVLVALVSQHHCLLLVSSGNDEACFDPEISPEAMPPQQRNKSAIPDVKILLRVLC